MNIPNDPYILLSYINTKLRDDFANLEDLCQSLMISKDNLISSLDLIGYHYDEDQNRFMD